MNMTVDVEWGGDELLEKIFPILNQGVNKGAILIQGEMIKNLRGSEGGGPIESRVTGTSLRRNKKTGTITRRVYRAGVRAGSDFTMRAFGRNMLVRAGRRYWVGPGAPPGRFPYKRSGRLQQSVQVEPSTALNARIGTSVPYARPLEFGAHIRDRHGNVRYFHARPFARRTLKESTERAVEVFARHASQGIARMVINKVHLS